MKKIIVIGAGAAGMMAAGVAASKGAEVLLLEKKDRPGRKLCITGKGRCNITSAVEPDELIKGFPGNGRFLYSAFHAFSNQELLRFFHERGLATKVERGNRVFPVSDRAEEVVDILRDFAAGAGAKFHFEQAADRIEIKAGRVCGVKAGKEVYPADAVIICTGGMSYPGTGSTGDGYRLAGDAGHSIKEPRPGLVPLITAETWVKELQGLALKNVKATAFSPEGKKINEDFGEMLFTHFGVSGPIILSMSHDIGEYLYKKKKPVQLVIDLKPALTEEKLEERLQRDFDKYARKMFKNSLGDLLPQTMIPVAIMLSGIDPEKECSQISKAERRSLMQILKKLTLTVTAARPIQEAIVTAGGVNIKEIDPKTMESKLVKGLFIAGEVLDVDGYTGGYNLQAAFSTGYIAGLHAAEERA